MREVKTQLVINTLTREKYNQLCAAEEIAYDQLYLVEDTVLDAFSKRVVNVATPLSADDAVTKDYVDMQFVKTTGIRSYIDNSKLYSINATEYPYGTQYVDGALRVFLKENTLQPGWKITVISGDVDPDDVTLAWTGETFGWEFSFDGKSYFGSNKTETADSSRVTSDGYNILAERIWPQVDSYVSKKQVYSKLSAVNAASQLSDVCAALAGLNSLLSSYAG